MDATYATSAWISASSVAERARRLGARRGRPSAFARCAARSRWPPRPPPAAVVRTRRRRRRSSPWHWTHAVTYSRATRRTAADAVAASAAVPPTGRAHTSVVAAEPNVRQSTTGAPRRSIAANDSVMAASSPGGDAVETGTVHRSNQIGAEHGDPDDVHHMPEGRPAAQPGVNGLVARCPRRSDGEQHQHHEPGGDVGGVQSGEQPVDRTVGMVGRRGRTRCGTRAAGWRGTTPRDPWWRTASSAAARASPVHSPRSVPDLQGAEEATSTTVAADVRRTRRAPHRPAATARWWNAAGSTPRRTRRTASRPTRGRRTCRSRLWTGPTGHPSLLHLVRNVHLRNLHLRDAPFPVAPVRSPPLLRPRQCLYPSLVWCNTRARSGCNPGEASPDNEVRLRQDNGRTVTAPGRFGAGPAREAARHEQHFPPRPGTPGWLEQRVDELRSPPRSGGSRRRGDGGGRHRVLRHRPRRRPPARSSARLTTPTRPA